MLLKLFLYSTTVTVIINASKVKNGGTDKWFRKNNNVFKGLMYTEEQTMGLKDEVADYPTAKLSHFSKFWSKPITSDECSTLRKSQNMTRFERSGCSSCCTTVLSAIAPLSVKYNGMLYDVYHPTGGYQIMFIGDCERGTRCDYGHCQAEDDYHTWILVHDFAMTYIPQIRFVPVTFSKFCKCIGS